MHEESHIHVLEQSCTCGVKRAKRLATVFVRVVVSNEALYMIIHEYSMGNLYYTTLGGLASRRTCVLGMMKLRPTPFQAHMNAPQATDVWKLNNRVQIPHIKHPPAITVDRL